MNKIHCCLALVTSAMLLCCPEVKAFTEAPPVGIEFLDAKGITALSDEKLVDTYIDALTEIEAERMLFTTVQFSTKEYNAYKDVIRYRYKLLMEINRRKLEVPAVAN